MTGTNSEALPIETKRPRASLGVGTKCRDICRHHRAKFIKGSRYEKGQRYCSTCEAWVSKKGIIIIEGRKQCLCCNSKTRARSPHSKKEFKTQRGDRAFNYLKIAMAELQNGFKILPLYYKCDPKLAHHRVDSLLKNSKLVQCLIAEVKTFKRQRHERIDQKYQKIIDMIETTLKKMPNM